MADNEFDRRIKENLTELEKLREHISPMDQARFDDAWEAMYSTVKDYLQKLASTDLGHIDAARPWYENLADAVILQEGNQPPRTGEEIIDAMERITERVRNLPDPARTESVQG